MPLFPEPDAPSSAVRRMLLVAVVAFVLCCLIVFGTAVQNYMEVTMRRGEDVTFWRMARWPLFWWLGWVPLAPFASELAWRRPVTRGDVLRPLLLLAAGCAAFFALHVAYQVATMYLPPFRMIHPDLADAVEYHALTSLYLNVFVYVFIVVSAHAVRVYRQAQRRALRAAQLESELAKARLDALKMQLHPHFLFNTLHGISTLMYRDVATADRMVTRLSRLLRHTLDRSDAHEVTLREEMDFLEEYLAIEQLRFGDDLRVRFDVDGAAPDVLVPSFVFQPLVENALKHAVAPSGNAGTITVRAWTDDGRLRLAVEDDGPGLGAGDAAVGAGVGLSNLQDRLRRLYGEAFALELRDAEPRGLVVDLTLPLRRSPRQAAARPTPSRVVPDALERED